MGMRFRRGRRRSRDRRLRIIKLLGLLAALSAALTFAIHRALQPGPWQRVFATREGLEGHRLACGEIIRAGAMFVALPHPAALRRNVEVRYAGRAIVVPVLDIGPWNIADAYWERSARPAAEQGRGAYRKPVNPAGIDLSDSTFATLGLKSNDYVEWRFVHQGYVPLPRLFIDP
jgi:hypothetical protein